jgi:hypothetical protein
MLHMELFYHLYTETFPELDRRKDASHFLKYYAARLSTLCRK